MKSSRQPLDADVPARSVRVHASLPTTERKSRLAAVLSFLLHALIIYFAIRLTATVAIPEHSPLGDAIKLVLGGGGGGGGRGGTAFDHAKPPPPPPVAPPVVPPPEPVVAVTPPVVPPPAPPPAATTSPEPAPVSPAAGAGSGGGTGGGSGTGEGPGTGGGRGPGSGGGSGGGTGRGNGGSPAVSKQLILPPTEGIPKELRGQPIEVVFFITPAGLVSDIKVTPPIANRGFARKFDEIMRAYTFTPARDAAGTRIASSFSIQFILGSK